MVSILGNTVVMHSAILRTGTALMAALALMSCHPIEEPVIPQEGYFYVLELGASTVDFPYYGGTYTLEPKGVTFLDGHIVSEVPLLYQEFDVALKGGNEDFLIREGFTFSCNSTTKNNVAYYKFTWKERGITKDLCVAQKKRQ